MKVYRKHIIPSILALGHAARKRGETRMTRYIRKAKGILVKTQAMSHDEVGIYVQRYAG